MKKRSLRIRIEGLVPARYEAYAAEQKEKLFHVFLGGNAILRTMNALTGRRPTRMFDRQSKANLLNALPLRIHPRTGDSGLLHDVSPTEH